jgi:hypothetical protein
VGAVSEVRRQSLYVGISAVHIINSPQEQSVNHQIPSACGRKELVATAALEKVNLGDAIKQGSGTEAGLKRGSKAG